MSYPALSQSITPPDNNDIADIIHIFTNRKYLILIFVMVGAFLSYFYVSNIQEQYESRARVMLTNPSLDGKPSNALQTFFSTGKLDVADLLSQIEIIKSPAIIQKLAVKNNLFQDPEFAGSLSFNTFNDIPIHRQRAIINRITRHLSITPVLGTSIIEVQMKTRDPVKSAEIVNALIDVYRTNEVERLQNEAHKQSNWLAQRLEKLEDQAKSAEITLEHAKEKNNVNMIKSDDSRLVKIDYLTQELLHAQAAQTQTQATLKAIEEARKNNRPIDAIPDILNNKVIEDLKSEDGKILKREGFLKQRYGVNHPAMVEFRAELKGFKNRLNQEIETIYDTLKNKLIIEEKRLEGLNEKIAQYRTSYQNDKEQRLEIRNLETSANTARSLLNNFTKSYLESLQNLKLDNNPIRVIVSAIPNHAPVHPKKSLIIVLSTITCFFLGLFVALILERIKNTIQTPHQIETMTGRPVYGILPKARMTKKQTSSDYILDNPVTLPNELVRSLYTNIHLRSPHKQTGGRIITLSSTLPSDGKTNTAIWLATTAAQNGDKVIIVDMDMRQPSLHKAYKIGQSKGVVDYLSDRLPLDDTIYKKHRSGVHIMTSKAIPTHALTLLNSERIEILLRRLKDQYDTIIIDSPTTYVFSDAFILSKLSNDTLYVVESERTKIDEFMLNVRQFADMGCENLGFVLNKVDNKQIKNILSAYKNLTKA